MKNVTVTHILVNKFDSVVFQAHPYPSYPALVKQRQNCQCGQKSIFCSLLTGKRVVFTTILIVFLPFLG